MGHKMLTKTTTQILKEMSVGEKHGFPLRKLGSVKTMCVQYGLQWGKMYSTHVVAQEGIIEVTRTK